MSDEDFATFQERVAEWSLHCFGSVIPRDRLERGDRMLEEIFELLQSGEYPVERVAMLRDYVWSRPVGEPAQEMGGAYVTLALYAWAHGLDMRVAAETELARIWLKAEAIREKQKTKPKGSPLPIPAEVLVEVELFDLLDLFREFVIQNVTQWKTGAGDHHHPMWVLLANHLGRSYPPKNGPDWRFIQPDNRLTLAEIKNSSGGGGSGD